MRVLIFEFVTGGGWFRVDPLTAPTGNLLAQGQAMAHALMEDFSNLPDVEVATLHDTRLPLGSCGQNARSIGCSAECEEVLADLAGEVDYSIVIAPEFDDHLLRISSWVRRFGGNLLSPAPEFIALAADKQATAEYLAQKLVNVPKGMALPSGDRPPSDFQFPAVYKPLQGAGSEHVRMLNSFSEVEKLPLLKSQTRFEPFHAGLPVSVSGICGPRGTLLLPPTLQRLSADGRFQYRGGAFPLPRDLEDRALRVAKQAFAALPDTVGYVGIDIVLGNDSAGTQDVVIEVNPRMTTSYVGLRRILSRNLAAVILGAANGETFELSHCSGRVEFSADGTVEHFP